MDTIKIPDFIQRDPDVILDEYKDLFQQSLGREIEPSQVEQLIINAIAYREVLLVNRFNSGLSQLLYQFSSAPVLDYIAALVAVERLPEANAGCTVRFRLVEGHGSVLIPEGTRVASSDGNAVFETAEDLIIPAGINEVEAYVSAQTAGESHNGYAPGTINKILDPYAFISSVANLDTTGGGSDMETDEQLRERIKLAPSQFSSAGSRQSYIFYAKSANTLIKDVSVSSPLPGTVVIVPLTDSEELEQTVLEEIYAACNDEQVRPLTDTVIVTSAQSIDYKIEVDITLYDDAEAATVKSEIEAALKTYTENKRKTLGQDIVLSHIYRICRLEDVYDVEIQTPANNLIVNEDEFANCEGITVNIIGFNRG